MTTVAIHVDPEGIVWLIVDQGHGHGVELILTPHEAQSIGQALQVASEAVLGAS